MTVRAIFGVLFGLLVSIAGVALVAWLLWWLWTRREEEAEEPALIEIEVEVGSGEDTAALPVEMAEEAAAAEPPAEPAAEKDEEQAPVRPDDLKVIEGIGPKIESVLQAAGIATYDRLAAAEPAHLADILEAADPRLRRLADPTTWPEQAALAAAGRLDDLQTLQATLKGGRRVR